MAYYSETMQVGSVGVDVTSESVYPWMIGKNLISSTSYVIEILQTHLPPSVPFPCPLNNTRSNVRPTSVHALRPGDFDITAAIGDSLGAGNGLTATNILHAVIENRGISYSSGGQGNWRQYLTIPNILKEFNPSLFGYALRDSYGHHKEAVFSVAEPGAISGDMPYMTQVLITRLKLDKRVNMEEHWKIVHLFIGGNDFCIDMCYHSRPEDILESHRRDLLEVLRTLKRSLPKTFVNVILSPNLRTLTDITLSNRPALCYISHNFICPCMFGLQFASLQDRFTSIMEKWQDIDVEITSRDEFDTDDFTVMLQPVTKFYRIPKDANGLTDYSSFSQDCFHLSQKEGARAALSIWNNLLEPVGKKSTVLSELFNIKCPTEENPFIFTRRNSV